GAWSDGAVRRLMVDADSDLAKLLELARADLTAHDGQDQDKVLAALSELEARCTHLGETHDVPRLRSPLNGRELMAVFGKGPGPWLRQVKAYLLDQVLEGHLAQDDKAGAERMAREYAERAFQEETTGGGPR
ncbi:MAG: RNA nucleotidyltransferase, partial [Dehalococcoidia bacterium]|nr:RNA nucleotidyltransferase [Dehalococcoidia bacterium]